MSVTDKAAVLGPYAEYLLDNQDVQANLKRAAAASRDAYDRARGKKRKADAVQDRQIRRRVLEAAQAAREVVLTVGREREKEQRGRRARVVFGLGLVGAGVGVALVPQVRTKLLSLVQGGSNDAPPAE